jgi:hypothetical protein
MPKVRMLQNSDTYHRGDVVDCTEVEANILTAPDGFGGQRAERVEQVPRHVHKFDGSAVDRALKAEDLPSLGDAHDAVEPRKGRYSRRDMRAKDE